MLSRDEWGAAPRRGGTVFNDAAVVGVAIHWQGPPVGASTYRGDKDAVARTLLADQRYHMSGRGWSDIAYNLAVDNAGRIWELRGLDYRSAANGDTDPNAKYVAILAVLGEGQTATDAMLTGVGEAIRLVRKRYPRAAAVRGHADVRPTPTACPGRQLLAACHDGDLDRRARGTTPDPPEDDMAQVDQKVFDQLVADVAAIKRDLGAVPTRVWSEGQGRKYGAAFARMDALAAATHQAVRDALARVDVDDAEAGRIADATAERVKVILAKQEPTPEDAA